MSKFLTQTDENYHYLIYAFTLLKCRISVFFELASLMFKTDVESHKNGCRVIIIQMMIIET